MHMWGYLKDCAANTAYFSKAFATRKANVLITSFEFFLEHRAAFLWSDLLIHLAKQSWVTGKKKQPTMYLLLYNSNSPLPIDTIFFLSKLLTYVFRMLKTLLVSSWMIL